MKKLLIALVVGAVLLGGLSLMPDAPDFYQYQLAGTRNSLADMAELAARWPARSVYSRSGQTLWYEDGEGGLSPWTISTSGGGALVKVGTHNTEWGGYSLEVRAGNDLLRRSTITHYFAPIEHNKWGVEVGVAFISEFEQYKTLLLIYGGGDQYEARVEFNRTLGEIQVYDDAAGMVKIDDLANPINAYGAFHQIKLTIDAETMKYVRLQHNDEVYDLSAYSLKHSASAEPSYQYISHGITGRAGFNDSVGIGHTIITVGEP